MTEKKNFNIGDTVYYKTRNNRAGRGVIKHINGCNAILEYRIQTKQMGQTREIIRPLSELFVTAHACEQFIEGNGGMGVPTDKMYNQFYWIKMPQNT